MSIKNIIVIGGSGSIGSALSKELKKNNYEPILIARNEENLKKISNELNCKYFVGDVLKIDSIDKIIKNLGDNIHGLAYCVGSINLRPISLTKDEDYIESFKINTLGAINAIKLALPSLKKNKGSILLYSTVAVKQGFVNHTVISTAKGAVEGLTLSLAAELAPTIRVNCIAPSLTNSNMTNSIISNINLKKAIEVMHPIPKIGEGDDFSHIGAFLLSEKNKWMTGQILHIDGGRSTLRIKS
jgi:NAD(P)-dependent dehydrogenase (short-subunit alcohol dehydrogenase family)|tara:strand:- start:5198 stop:5923 length:726 start_codon:yes stop_codon:yes gene_type:complete